MYSKSFRVIIGRVFLFQCRAHLAREIILLRFSDPYQRIIQPILREWARKMRRLCTLRGCKSWSLSIAQKKVRQLSNSIVYRKNILYGGISFWYDYYCSVVVRFHDGLKVMSSLKYIFNIASNKCIFLRMLLFDYPKFLFLCSPLYWNICGFYSFKCLELTKFLIKVS